MGALNWQKSSFSSGDGNTSCVEVARDTTGTLHLRESDEPGNVLATRPTALRAMLARLKSDADGIPVGG